MKPETFIYVCLVLLLWVAGASEVYGQESKPTRRLKSSAVVEQKDTTVQQTTAPKDTIYNGMSLKVDLFNSILEPARSKGSIQNYEIAMNWRLKQRFFPTLELGYAQAETAADGGKHKGLGGFARVGLDLNVSKKHVRSENVMLVGLRVGTALQRYDLTEVPLNNNYWGTQTMDFRQQFGADCWGEVVAGCQVQVWKGLQMGWYLRFKILFTRKAKDSGVLPYYLPGFGYRDDTNWGISYYIGGFF
ncbi:MAG: DUF6048 family protein [Paludibacteraceae bacterium]